MENTSIIVNDEVMEVTEELVPSGSGTGWKLAGGLMLAVGAIYGGYKLLKKFKAKKESKCEVIDVDFNSKDNNVDED